MDSGINFQQWKFQKWNKFPRIQKKKSEQKSNTLKETLEVMPWLRESGWHSNSLKTLAAGRESTACCKWTENHSLGDHFRFRNVRKQARGLSGNED